ncbi:hypothetical protein RIF29_39426 [Crotalaria pallida]|uniref:Uncharacterized protein n=1 Tax=Crotalaria pallida TaxID=3830 RepID=A0AAN9E3M5_CROPI
MLTEVDDDDDSDSDSEEKWGEMHQMNFQDEDDDVDFMMIGSQMNGLKVGEINGADINGACRTNGESGWSTDESIFLGFKPPPPEPPLTRDLLLRLAVIGALTIVIVVMEEVNARVKSEGFITGGVAFKPTTTVDEDREGSDNDDDGSERIAVATGVPDLFIEKI